MASTVQVSDEDRAAAAATNIRTQYQALHNIAQTLKQGLASQNGYTTEQLKTALGKDLETIQTAVDGIK